MHFTRLPHATDPLFAEPVPSVKRLLVGILKASHFQPAMGSRKKSSPNSSYSKEASGDRWWEAENSSCNPLPCMFPRVRRIHTLTSGCISHGSLMQQILFLPSLCPLSKGFWWESSKPAIFSQLWVHAKSPLLTHPIPRAPSWLTAKKMLPSKVKRLGRR